MSNFVSFGEIMLRLKIPGHERFFQSPAFDATFGGGANVAVALANYAYDDRNDSLNFAVAASCLKHSISGDFNCALQDHERILSVFVWTMELHSHQIQRSRPNLSAVYVRHRPETTLLYQIVQE